MESVLVRAGSVVPEVSVAVAVSDAGVAAGRTAATRRTGPAGRRATVRRGPGGLSETAGRDPSAREARGAAGCDRVVSFAGRRAAGSAGVRSPEPAEVRDTRPESGLDAPGRACEADPPEAGRGAVPSTAASGTTATRRTSGTPGTTG
ncbi:hypothetical protein [Streptomyces africanus]|uniref:hypothetical protein n=1 Tax=Streptomyces africanus TaxID=231024 RepID=UPI001FC96377|nr:hypothetical protein [Streptomyces africanus]